MHRPIKNPESKAESAIERYKHQLKDCLKKCCIKIILNTYRRSWCELISIITNWIFCKINKQFWTDICVYIYICIYIPD